MNNEPKWHKDASPEDLAALEMEPSIGSKDANVLGVPIPFDGVLWNITPIAKESEDGVLVELQWGWTAGMSEEDLKNYAEDAPSGYESVTTTLDFAMELVNQLNEIIEKCKERNEQIKERKAREFDEKFPNFNEMLQVLVNKNE